MLLPTYFEKLTKNVIICLQPSCPSAKLKFATNHVLTNFSKWVPYYDTIDEICFSVTPSIRKGIFWLVTTISVQRNFNADQTQSQLSKTFLPDWEIARKKDV